ncbi:MAG: MarR family transcriptional regulator [Acidimicrobiaceae bacterium]|nr:MarR family transcriptional regulator [Acidimicrobiaceae bacterium]
MKTSTTGSPKATTDEAAERLRTVFSRLSRSLRLTHADDNLSPSQREVLRTINRRGPLRLSELAATEGLNPTMVSRIVSNLETRDLVTRSTDGTDARIVHLAVTEKGRALWQEMKHERTDALLFALGQLPKDQRNELIKALPALEGLVAALRGD